MRLRTLVVQQGHDVTLETDPKPSPAWQSDGAIRWLIVEAATRDELEKLFDELGAEGAAVADHITGDRWSQWIERQHFTATAKASPTAWSAHETWFHFVAVAETVVSVHKAEIPEMDSFIQNRWLDRPAPEAAMDSVLLRVIQGYVEEEADEFDRVRLQVEKHAEGLRRGDKSFTVERLEELMTVSTHMSTVFFEYQRLCDSLEFARTSVISLDTHKELFRRGVETIRSIREGVEQLHRRLEELQRQHLMDRQVLTERRLRVLTILSAIFLPMTLIAGIYGMNFTNMPELDEGYAYFIALGGMAALGILMMVFFIRKGWFR